MTPAPVAVLLADRYVAILARVLLTISFWLSAIAKLLDPVAAIAEARSFGLERALLIAAALVERDRRR